MNPHRKAQKELKEQIAEELADLKAPIVLSDDVWASVLRMPVEDKAKKDSKKKEKDRENT
jgi:hypothetical protein